MIEPSDIERAELPETTVAYLADLEEENARLRDALMYADLIATAYIARVNAGYDVTERQVAERIAEISTRSRAALAGPPPNEDAPVQEKADG